jgi:hypothetical protein
MQLLLLPLLLPLPQLLLQTLLQSQPRKPRSIKKQRRLMLLLLQTLLLLPSNLVQVKKAGETLLFLLVYFYVPVFRQSII